METRQEKVNRLLKIIELKEKNRAFVKELNKEYESLSKKEKSLKEDLKTNQLKLF
jgi:FtsZ-binding cell division protein ZapB